MEIKYKKYLLLSFMLYSSFCLSEGEPSLVISAGIERDDNIGREADNKVSSSTYNLSGQLSYADNGEWYRYNIGYRSDFEYYENSVYDNRQNTNGSSSLVLGRSSSWISWSFRNSETSTSLNTSEADLPTNRSQRSSYSTGPALIFRLSKRDSLIASSQYQITKVEDSTGDSERIMHQFSWQHSLSNNASFALSGNRTVIDPEASEGDYTQQGYRLELNRKIKDGQIKLAAGKADITRSSVLGLSETNTEEYQLAINKSTPVGSFALSSVQSLSDSGTGDIDFGVDGYDIGARIFEVEKRKSHQFSFGSKPFWNSTSVSLSVRRSEAERLSSNVTEISEGVSISVSKQLSTSTSIYARYGRIETDSDEGTDFGGSRNEDNYSLGGSYRFSESITGSCELKRQESTGNRKFSANQIYCSASYRVF